MGFDKSFEILDIDQQKLIHKKGINTVGNSVSVT